MISPTLTTWWSAAYARAIRIFARAFTAVAWTGFGVALLLGLTGVMEFEFASDTGIVSYVSRNRYPIQQELFWFYSATLGVPCIVLLGHLLARLARLDHTPWLAVAIHGPLLLLWWPLADLDAASSLMWAAIASAAMLTALLVAGLLRRRHPTCEALVLEADPSSRISVTPTRQWLNWLQRSSTVARWVLLLGVAPIYLYLCRISPHITRGIDLFHEGEYLVPLQEAWRGAIPYRDIYLQHGFLHNLGIPWLSAKCFGYSLGAVRTGHALIEPLGWIGAYLFLVGLVRGRLLPSLLFVVLAAHMPTQLLPRAFFGLCSLGLFAGYLHTRGRAWGVMIVGSGILAAVALLHSVEVGLYTLAACMVVLVARALLLRHVPANHRIRVILAYGCGMATVLIPFLIWLGTHGAADDFARNIHLQVFHQLEVWGVRSQMH